jgi:hypothetical protein
MLSAAAAAETSARAGAQDRPFGDFRQEKSRRVEEFTDFIVAVKYKTCDNSLMNVSISPAPAQAAPPQTSTAQGSTPAAALLPLAPAAKLHHDALPRLEVAPNSRVTVNFNPLGSGGTPIHGEFLGTTHYEFLIIRLPSIPGLRSKLLPHMRVEISYVADGARSQFAAEIIGFTQKPVFLLFTSYPDRVSVMETRNYSRVACALSVSFVSPYGEGVGIVSDLSKGGCRVVLDMTGQSALRKLKAGDRLVLLTAFTWDKPAVKGVGIVRTVEISGARMTLGLAFGETIGEFVDALMRYLSLVSVLN